jgi:MFS family permease
LKPIPRFPEAACARFIRAPALVNVRLLRVRSVGASSAALFLTGACMYGAMFLLPLYYQELRGFDVLGAALALIPQGVGSLLTRTVTGRLTDRIGGRAVAVAGFVMVALATVPLALAGPGTSEWWLGAVLLVRGLGLGVAIGAVVLESAVASGHTLTQAFGQAFWWTTGFTVLAVLASFFLPGRRVPAAGQPTVPAQGQAADPAPAGQAA